MAELGPWEAQVLRMEVSHLRQVVKHDPPNTYGDCFRTTIACLIGADDPTVVPHFVADTIANNTSGDPPAWADLRAAREWLRLNLDLDIFPLAHDVADEMDVHYKGSVLSPAGVWHSVVAKAGEVAWCPAGYPTDELELLRVDSAWVITEPWSPRPKAMVDEWRRASVKEAQNG